MESVSNIDVIRPASEQDYISMDRLQTASVRACCSPMYTPELIESWVGTPKPERYLNGVKKGAEYFVLVKGDVLLGFCGIHLARCFIEAVFVSPEGSGQGFGSKMLEHLFEIADQHEIDELFLESSLNAVDFYARHGFVEYNRKQVALSDGQTIEGVLMRRAQV